MLCPDCKDAALELAKTRRGVWVDHCGRCGGMWLDKGEIFCFSNDPRGLYAELKTAFKAPRPTARVSPKSGRPMREVSLRGGKLMIDFDPPTEGFWFDKGELEGLTGTQQAGFDMSLDPANPPAPTGAVISEVANLPPEAEWSLWSIMGEFKDVKEQIQKTRGVAPDDRPGVMTGLNGYFGRIGYTLQLTLKEKEIITFALLQWVAIALGYYLWVQMLGWIPEEVWESARDSDEGSIADIVLLLWSFVCVGLTALPLGFLTACMGAVHFLHKHDRPSTIAGCFNLVMPRVWPIWVFSWADAWITVNRILERLPRKNDRRTTAQKALAEILYFAWKLGTLGIIPGLVTGRGLIESCKLSIGLVKAKTAEVLSLRIGYSALCWVVGIAAYAGTIWCMPWLKETIGLTDANLPSKIYFFYVWMGIPLLTAAGIVLLFLRPVYVIASCDIYSDFLIERREKVLLPAKPSRGTSVAVAFFILCVVVAAVYLYREPLGIMDMLATPYWQEYNSVTTPGSQSP